MNTARTGRGIEEVISDTSIANVIDAEGEPICEWDVAERASKRARLRRAAWLHRDHAQWRAEPRHKRALNFRINPHGNRSYAKDLWGFGLGTGSDVSDITEMALPVFTPEPRLPTVERTELEQMVYRAQEAARQAGYSLPGNLYFNGPVKGMQRYVSIPDPGKRLLEKYARFAGFLRALGTAHTPLLNTLIRRTVSERGFFSPATTTDLWALHEKCFSPLGAEKQIARARRGANEILANYGLNVSWKALGKALSHFRNHRRAARYAADITVTDFLAKKGVYLRSTTRGLMKQVGCLIQARGMKDLVQRKDNALYLWVSDRMQEGAASIREIMDESGVLEENISDGVRCLIDTTLQDRILVGEAAYTVFHAYGVQRMLLVREDATGRTYHSSDRWPSSLQALSEALRAWALQDEFRKELVGVTDLFDFELAVPLIWMSDSQRAGNCVSGTENWLREHGFEGRAFVPATSLLQFADDRRVQAVLFQAARRRKAA